MVQEAIGAVRTTAVDLASGAKILLVVTMVFAAMFAFAEITQFALGSLLSF